MPRRVWFLAAAVLAVLGPAGSAAGMAAAGSSVTSNLHAAPFAKAWANVPRTPAAREAKKTMVFGLEQTVTGFNTLDADEIAFYAAIVGTTPVLEGNYILDQNGNYHLAMASKVVATKKYLKIWIRKDANWYWVGHKLIPVTAADYVYTFKQITDPNNNVASSTGYTNISHYKINSKKVVTFYWRKGQPVADYRDLFGEIFPGFALKGQSFNTYWHNCVCGNDGHPISDGPFYLANYTPGQG